MGNSSRHFWLALCNILCRHQATGLTSPSSPGAVWQYGCTKAMKPTTAIFLLLILLSVQSCHTANKFGLYSGSNYTSGYSFILKPDGTFEYKLRGHMVSDTSAGHYHMKGDTIYLNYIYDPYKSEVLPPPIPARPKFAIWRKNKLYPFYSGDEQLNRKQVLRYSN